VSAIGTWLYEAVAARVNSLEGNGILNELNLLAVEKGYHAMATASVLALHRERRELYYSNAGHPPLWLFSRRHGSWEPLEVNGDAAHANLPLGVFDDAEYPQAVRGVEAGDWILAFTDGVTEATNAEGAMFGLQGLLEVMRQHPCQDAICFKSAVLGALTAHTGGRMVHDDVTLMVLEVL
jgi:serine phosphatase RsbU (regulator of sigma subunit)